MKLWPDIHRIEGEFNGNALCMYLLCGAEKTMLIDSGIPSTPEDVFFPYLSGVGMQPTDIDAVIVTHASADHFGGNTALCQAAPDIQIIAHRLDVGSISNLDHHLKENFADAAQLGYPWPEDAFTLTRDLFGAPLPVDWVVEGGETIDLGDDWKVMLRHTPGHTPGHLTVWDPRHKAAFIGDAILGRGVTSLAGSLVSPPPYFDVDNYRKSIAQVRALSPEYILATHYPVIKGEKVAAFLEESDAFVRWCEYAVLAMLDEAESLTFREIVDGLEHRVGPPGAVWRLTARAHLNKLVEMGQVALVGDSPRWTLSRVTT